MNSVLKTMEWNWRGAAASGWDNEYQIMPWMVNRIMDAEWDVIVINEFVIADGWDYFRKKLIKNGYCWFMTYTSFENGILIALKRDTFGIKSREDLYVTKQIQDNNANSSDFPDFLAVTLKYKHQPLTIVGTRIKVLVYSNSMDEDFKFRKRQFDLLVEYLSKIEGRVIVMGDFNNGSIFKESDKDFIYNNCARQYYSYQMIWRTVEDNLKLSLSTPDRGGRYGNKYSFVTIDGILNKTYFTKDDHIISRGFKTRKCDYIWDFLTAKNGYKNIVEQDYKGYIRYIPDHAILCAELVLL